MKKLIGFRNIGNDLNLCGVILRGGVTAEIYSDLEVDPNAEPITGQTPAPMSWIISEGDKVKVTRHACEYWLESFAYCLEAVYEDEKVAPPAPPKFAKKTEAEPATEKE